MRPPAFVISILLFLGNIAIMYLYLYKAGDGIHDVRDIGVMISSATVALGLLIVTMAHITSSKGSQ